ncbi:DNA recombination protein RmuC [Ferroacidibacillus organovorans]|uniref:Recombinase RmuC n=1 Tax=Ferroacidibacillus organovorans TaxID=1765683 RepID=A0A853KB76_9BACL|nr:DNA recombination protein RmuC [Ferroacidibacillus organovorans]KYP80291.1 hypothetical protein AYJ22_11860 [Ferroacidibacillus organovorans]OAG93369.1 hypothetical protein AYW79_11015 [Ferroacidibacillus organovorans]
MTNRLIVWLQLVLIALGIATFFMRKSKRSARGEDFYRMREEISQEIANELSKQRVEDAQQSAVFRQEISTIGSELRQTVEALSQQMQRTVQAGYQQLAEALERSSASARRELAEQSERTLRQTDERLASLQGTVDEKLRFLQQSNEQKLEQMRQTVDEKLHATLERRLGESFRLVSERLEQVHKGLGDMQTLAHGVGDLKRMMQSVKVRGTWGEVQLQALLEHVLTEGQYARNVQVTEGSAERVDFAIRLPGRSSSDEPVWLPLDSKFPLEDYQRLVEAQETADLARMEEAGKALERRLQQEAGSIAAKYIHPPATTDFALLFLPTEGLYAEAIRRPGLVERLQRDHRVVIAGPTTLGALLNSLQMGFRTLAIEQRSTEVWKTLGSVKTEFQKFGSIIEKVRKKMDAASSEFHGVEVRTRALQRALRAVEELPVTEHTAPSVELQDLVDDEDHGLVFDEE